MKSPFFILALPILAFFCIAAILVLNRSRYSLFSGKSSAFFFMIISLISLLLYVLVRVYVIRR